MAKFKVLDRQVVNNECTLYYLEQSYYFSKKKKTITLVFINNKQLYEFYGWSILPGYVSFFVENNKLVLSDTEYYREINDCITKYKNNKKYNDIIYPLEQQFLDSINKHEDNIQKITHLK